LLSSWVKKPLDFLPILGYDKIVRLKQEIEMPNWCQNYVSFSHEDPSMVKKLVEAAQNNELFNTFVPLSSGKWDYDTAVNEWGTKWEASVHDAHQVDGYADLFFETAWSPPIEFYEAMTKLGFKVDATYNEPGTAFAGHYNEDGDYCVEYDFGNENWRDSVEDDVVLDLLENEYDNYLMWMEEEK